ncbi:MAG: ROK family protein [Rhodospirillales bacterium]|nr:ROK family protein [Rhodospirillales bacterium]MCW8862245.1 ROK family protein [Rhodospirillales bacterium]MCW8952959.1 ROK family protein [Rhodospirillales bacterium]MCW8969957.1 ROK family protein [Rhodospirillales bacterium]MCW9002784.1 ROK family protein [Rhodospirillales bacterium]
MRIGIDLGGTKIEALALDATGREQGRLRADTPQGDYDGTVRAVRDMVDALETATGFKASVGVGIPGALSRATGLVKNANSTCLIGRPLQSDLEAALGRTIRLANDANCFAVSESVDGAGAGLRVVFGVIIGTGVGGGIAIDGRPLVGPNAIAGEWGHNPLPWPMDDERPGPPCYCGQQGCIETFLSGPGLAWDFQAPIGGSLSAKDIAGLAEWGDKAAKDALSRYADRLARALATVINLLDPDAIILGGGLSNIRELYDVVPRLWDDWVFSDRVDTPLLPNVHGDSSGVRGAAWLWLPDSNEDAP